jgi:DNA-binding NarL/FixJ family response regulator
VFLIREVRASSSAFPKKPAQTSTPASGSESIAARNPDHLASLARRVPPARVLVVDDHSFLREEIVGLINCQPDLVSCGQADSISSTPAAVLAHKPHVLLLDLRLKDGDSFGLISSLKVEFPNLAILILSQHDELLYAERAILAGARGYIMKQEAAEDLLSALRRVVEGNVYLSPAMSQRLVQRVLKPGSKTGNPDQSYRGHLRD